TNCAAVTLRAIVFFNRKVGFRLTLVYLLDQIESPPFDGAVGDFDQRCCRCAATLAMALTDLGNDRFKVGEGGESAQAIFQFVRNSQLRSVPGSKFAKQNTASLAVLFGHQGEV